MSVHEVAEAFPNGTVSSDTIRQKLAAAFPYVLETADAIESIDFTQLGAIAIPREVRLNGIAFLYDSADESSAHDGVTTLVSQDGKRFLSEISAGAFVSVLARQNAPPGAPVVGDKYIVGAAPTGDWAGNADDLVVFTTRGWEFAAPAIGQRVYVRDLDADLQWVDAGEWAQFGVTDASVALRNLVWPFGAAVEEETATPPTFSASPADPPAGTLYIVAVNATGAWDNHDGEVAEADGEGGWIFHDPYEGATVFNRDAGAAFSYIGGTWTTFSSALYCAAQSASSSLTLTGGMSATQNVGYVYSQTTAPATADSRYAGGSPVEFSVRAKAANEPIEVFFAGLLSLTASLQTNATRTMTYSVVAALFVDAEATARDWVRVPLFVGNGIAYSDSVSNTSGTTTENAEADIRGPFAIKFTLPDGFDDTDLHTLRLRFMFRTTVDTAGGTLANTGISAASVRRRAFTSGQLVAGS